mmetsp:Transcript_22862/g.37625  ORF Transcript_22862/g.37625 Transcript_22862/m.37625 type:complete len:485 (-) Transcript_22862:194-1648(-)|eukprot:CAMPEP_0184666186 /NCGR_PEP_ID=MMETSP0308-20130426/60321_1 /TAXON_ID=38269 /ORGANISM="Gloeochaete witrockiana, Strain SAG 46.84" /LENGTH=484 /DNA_ID=CAMNT_0027110633 /DNA_START=237 /DNA_END=1694 /DNA_ORIENTATION=+
MANWWVIVVAVVGSLIILAVNIYMIVYFQHPEDKNVAWFPKIVVLLGFVLAEISVLMLPLDVANRNDGLLPMGLLWQIVQIILAVMVFAVIPFAIFYYEAEDEDSTPAKQVLAALKWELFILVLVGLILGIMYALIGYVDVPVQRLPSSLLKYQDPPDFLAAQTVYETITVSFRCSFPVYVIGLVSFVGWFLFTLFGAIGMFAIPMDLINSFRKRPKRMSLDTFAQGKLVLRARAEKLKDIAYSFQKDSVRSAKDRRQFNLFKQAVQKLEDDWKWYKKCYKELGGNPLIPLFKLVAGLITFVIAVLWLLQIFLFLFLQPPATPFLNDYFIVLDNVFPLFGTITYGIFAFYLLWAVIKGNMKFGLNFLIFSVHRMRVGETMMNAFLFNTLLIVLSSFSVIQFCTQAFSIYARSTSASVLFTTQLYNLRYIKELWVHSVFLYGFFALSILTAFFLFFFPTKEKRLANRPDEVIKQLARREKASNVL